MNNTSNRSEGGILQTCPFPSLTLLQQSIRAGSILLLLILSFSGNIFVLCVVRNNTKLHTVTHFLIVNLATADLLVTVINMSALFTTEVTGHDEAFGGVAGQVYCIGLLVVLNLSIGCSILTLTAIAVERFCSIMFPFKRIITLKLAKVIMTGIWIASFAITIPFFFHIKAEDFHGDGVFYCVEDWSPLNTEVASKVFQVVFFLSLYACPLILICVLYFCIGVKLWRQRAKAEASSLGYSYRRMRMTVQVTKMLVVSVVAFALCWLPQHVALFMNYFMLDMCPPEFLWFGGTLLAYANSAVNPIIYVAFHSEYREQFKGILNRCSSLCVGFCKSSPNFNVNTDTKAERSVDINMINVLSYKPKSGQGDTTTTLAFSGTIPDTKSEQNYAFSFKDDTETPV